MAEAPKAWPLRCPKPLEAVQELLIDYLSSGQGYDDESVAAALTEGNQFFQQKDFSRACASFGIAYEIGRHHYAYRPLLHDLLLRRILCHSLLGHYDIALQEIEKADWLIPHQASARVIAGVVYSKVGMVTEANTAFQQAVAVQKDLKDFVDSMVAFFWLQHSADRAIRICTQVLQRNPRCPFALLIRAEAYKFGLANTQANRRNAAADYADLLEQDLGYQALIARPMADAHTRADELLLSFHPTLQMQAPKAYHQYALCRRKEPFLVATLVMLAVTKLRLLSSSGKVVRRVQEAYEELLEQKAELQRKVHFLLQSQRQAIASPLANQVYGPIDSANPHCRRYRRYWMEQSPPARPVRQVERVSDSRDPTLAPSIRRQQALLLAQQDAEAEHPRPKPQPQVVRHESFTAHQPAGEPAPVTSVPNGMSQPKTSIFSPEEAKVLPPSEPLPSVASPWQVSQEPVRSERKLVEPSVGPVSNGAGTQHERYLEEASLGSEPPLLPTMDPPKASPTTRVSQIQGWDEQQWLMKAQDLLKSYGIDPHQPILSASVKEEFKRNAEVPPPPNTNISTNPGMKSNKVMQKLDEYGFGYLPDWYTPLDRVHKVRDLTICRASVEPPVAVSGLLGVPGHSYVVPRTSLSRAASEERSRRSSTRR